MRFPDEKGVFSWQDLSKRTRTSKRDVAGYAGEAQDVSGGLEE